LALAFFFGDEFGAFAPFGIYAVAAILLASLLAARHHHRPIGIWRHQMRRDVHLTRGLSKCGKHVGAVCLGGVGVPGGCGQDNSAVGQLLIRPTTRPAEEGLDQVMTPIG